jgi:hypothetical protein
LLLSDMGILLGQNMIASGICARTVSTLTMVALFTA